MKEKNIKNKILKYLKAQHCSFAFKEFGGLYGTARIPDILCCYIGKFVAFEVGGVDKVVFSEIRSRLKDLSDCL